MTLLRRTCRQAAALLIAREDRALGLPDRIALKLHLMACQACPKFENQVLTMRAAMGRWRHYSGEAQRLAASGKQPPE
jgi:hypothetical protein